MSPTIEQVVQALKNTRRQSCSCAHAIFQALGNDKTAEADISILLRDATSRISDVDTSKNRRNIPFPRGIATYLRERPYSLICADRFFNIDIHFKNDALA